MKRIAVLSFKAAGRNFGKQNGNEITIGIDGRYQLNKTVSAFAGMGFVASKFTINTSPEFVSFYDHSKMIQIQIGIQLH